MSTSVWCSCVFVCSHRACVLCLRHKAHARPAAVPRVTRTPSCLLRPIVILLLPTPPPPLSHCNRLKAPILRSSNCKLQPPSSWDWDTLPPLPLGTHALSLRTTLPCSVSAAASRVMPFFFLASTSMSTYLSNRSED